MTCDEYKVSGEYKFSSQKGEVFTLYDWKATTLYDPESFRPSEFWVLTDPYPFHVGGKSEEGFNEFREWLKNKIKKSG